MTDLHTDLAAEGDWADAVVMAEVSRLVVDVERFRDDADEEMAAKGMGAVYTRTSDGHPLRTLTPERREELLRIYYDRHHQRLHEAVSEALKRASQCLIIDVHSFPGIPLPYESDQNRDRPQICIGTDDYHTPPSIAEAATAYFRERGFRVTQNRPFGGSIVPLAYYRRERMVQTVMVEFNRSLLCNEKTGELRPDGAGILKSISGLATYILG